MKNFIKENWFKVSIIVAILILAFTVYGLSTNSSNKSTVNNSSNVQTVSTLATSSEQAIITANSSIPEKKQAGTQQTSIANLQFQCAQLGATAKSDYEKKYPDISQVLVTDSVFHYDTVLNKCFYGRERHFGGGDVWVGITDLFSNKDVLYAWRIYSGDNPPKLVGDFSAITYVGYPNEQGGGVIKNEMEFEALYNKILTE